MVRFGCEEMRELGVGPEIVFAFWYGYCAEKSSHTKSKFVSLNWALAGLALGQPLAIRFHENFPITG
jgi:hypothetical protein